ncbi:MAG: TadE/TadG family type IV pilus assembly protein [Planctomycetaceae bacterium]
MTRDQQTKRTARRGTAAVEFAVCLPVIVMLVFGGIEASSMIFLKQSLNVAAYEGVREAASRSATNESTSARVSEILESRNVEGYRLQLPNRSVEQINRGGKIAIVVTAPSRWNSPIAGRFLKTTTVTARASMVKQ